MKRRCSVMPAHGPTAPPQMSKLGLWEDVEQNRREGAASWSGIPSFPDPRGGKGLLVGKAERIGGFELGKGDEVRLRGE